MAASRFTRNDQAPRIIVEGTRVDPLLRQVAAILTGAATQEGFGTSRHNTITILLNTQDPEDVARMNLDVFNTRSGKSMFFALAADPSEYDHPDDYKPRFAVFAETSVYDSGEDKDRPHRTSTIGSGLVGSTEPYSLTTELWVPSTGATPQPIQTETIPVKLGAVLDMAKNAAKFALEATRA